MTNNERKRLLLSKIKATHAMTEDAINQFFFAMNMHSMNVEEAHRVDAAPDALEEANKITVKFERVWEAIQEAWPVTQEFEFTDEDRAGVQRSTEVIPEASKISAGFDWD